MYIYIYKISACIYIYIHMHIKIQYCFVVLLLTGKSSPRGDWLTAMFPCMGMKLICVRRLQALTSTVYEKHLDSPSLITPSQLPSAQEALVKHLL